MKPTVTDYRVTRYDETRCMARRLGRADRRWLPAVWHEVQCGAAPEGTSDLCIGCVRNWASKTSQWLGRVSDAPPATAPMLGTKWATLKKPVFLPIPY